MTAATRLILYMKALQVSIAMSPNYIDPVRAKHANTPFQHAQNRGKPVGHYCPLAVGLGTMLIHDLLTRLRPYSLIGRCTCCASHDVLAWRSARGRDLN